MSHSNIFGNFALALQPKRTPKRRMARSRLTRHRTKQETALALLRHPKGTTVTAIIKATAWHGHSVRSFFVATVLKNLGLALSSETVGGARIYRVMTRIKSNPAPAVS